jgi:xanthine dehydrogenase accessory factor
VKDNTEIWKFIADRLERCEPVMLLVVVDSIGSSPGRRGYKMAVAAAGELCGTIGGGVMEVNLVEQSRSILRDPTESFQPTQLIEQVHQQNSPSASGMICSGRQTVLMKALSPEHKDVIDRLTRPAASQRLTLSITRTSFTLEQDGTPDAFEGFPNGDFQYTEFLNNTDRLIIVGGGHCALALSEVMSRLGFHISIFDDRPNLNTVAKNRFANAVHVIGSYDQIGDHIPASTGDIFVVVMTLGYRSDETVIRKLFDRQFRYFGVLGSKAKMAALFRKLRADGFSIERLESIHSPVGLPINSRTPEEIAISIAAEIIAVKNA